MALEHLESLVKLTWVDADEARAWRASILSGQGKHEEALRLMGARQMSDPMLIPVAAAAHARLGNREKALTLLQEAKLLELPDVEIAEGRVRAALGDHAGALDAYDRAIRTSFHGQDALRYVGESLLSLDDPEEAAAAFGLAVRLRPYLSVKDVSGMVTALHGCGRQADADRWAALLAADGPERIRVN